MHFFPITFRKCWYPSAQLNSVIFQRITWLPVGILPVYLPYVSRDSERSSGRTDFGSDRDGNDFLAVQAMDKGRTRGGHYLFSIPGGWTGVGRGGTILAIPGGGERPDRDRTPFL